MQTASLTDCYEAWDNSLTCECKKVLTAS